MANMPINLNQALRGVGNTDPIVVNSNMSFAPGSGVAMTAAVVAAAGSTTTDATETEADVVVIGSGGANTGVRFVGFTTGKIKLVYNHTSNAKLIYPPTGGSINGYTANDKYTLNSGLGVLFAATSSGGLVAGLIS